MKVKNLIYRKFGPGHVRATKRWLGLSKQKQRVACPFTVIEYASVSRKCRACHEIFPELPLFSCPCVAFPVSWVVTRAKLFIDGEI